ncbi:TROVE domain-containing protein [Stackebrandtia albiflava]|uniref:TROVE domain-containing protein n=1 Tax=Stackebrandtia albiflava TaxID=406432 RepID=A0A562UL38_9ACTN|nr:TROVE domain-containing protein [Stackebrandtia albiflava]TWJ06327.1 TROVE domain-containing protein [Stackebrandtia albiflava]
MSKFNTSKVRAAVGSVITATAEPAARTAEGAPGFARDPKSELFLLAVANMVGEPTFYESADGRDDRFRTLVHTVAVEDPAWTRAFLAWLRTGAHMRSAALVGGLEAAKALRDAGLPGGRQITASVLQRADEPGEAIAYWFGRYGRRIPKPVKRGIADAARRLYSERSLLKYDTSSHAVRFGDVLELTHPAPAADKPWQGALFDHALGRRRDRGNPVDADVLPVVARNAALRARVADDPTVLTDPDALRAAGMAWEDALSLAGPKADKARLWEAMIPSMGYMACLRNLRNFDEAGVSDEVAATVAARLSAPGEVARSRQLPMRFLSAYRAAPSLRWSYPLETALQHSLANIAPLPGRTLILVDTSGSMNARFSRDGTLMRWDAATLFGLAIADRSERATIVSFSGSWYGHEQHEGTKVFKLRKRESVLRALSRWRNDGYFIGGGTETEVAVTRHYRDHDRVIILTDEQAHGNGPDVTRAVPAHVPVYTWNLAGYRYGHAPSGHGTRHTFGGLTDAGFRMIPLLEAGRDGTWPWEGSDRPG